MMNEHSRARNNGIMPVDIGEAMDDKDQLMFSHLVDQLRIRTDFSEVGCWFWRFFMVANLMRLVSGIIRGQSQRILDVGP